MKTGIFIVLIIAAAISVYFIALPGEALVSHFSAAPQTSMTCAKPTDADDMIRIDGGGFIQGSADFYPEEAPPVKTEVTGFWIDKYEVTNAKFKKFVDETGYITVAERVPDPSAHPGIDPALLAPGSVVFIMPTDATGQLTQWWQFVPGANWRAPKGPGSSIDGMEHHPVVHVAYEDALAYADWSGHALPTEAQWEYAARGGLEKKTFAWGDAFLINEKHQANTWQGTFPVQNSKDDHFLGAAPVGCFPANGYGLHDMIGNVWEWVDDWYYPSHQFTKTETGSGYDPRQAGVPVKVIKGGSYLCAKNYCMRYRPAARHAQETSLGAAHIGFRTIKTDEKREK